MILVGNQKCGSTSLIQWLRTHPRVFNTTKEMFYFDKKKYTELQYMKKYPDCRVIECGNRIAIEGSVTYAFANTARKIKTGLPDVKLIFLTRNPVERAYSKFRMSIRDGVAHVNETFEESVVRDLPILQEFLESFQRRREKGIEETIWEYQENLHGIDRLDQRWQRNMYLSAGLYSYLLEPFLKVFPKDRIKIFCTRNAAGFGI